MYRDINTIVDTNKTNTQLFTDYHFPCFVLKSIQKILWSLDWYVINIDYKDKTNKLRKLLYV